MSDGLAGSCHCGLVRLTVAAAADEVTQCNCSLCTKLGTRWLYFRPVEVCIGGGPLDDYCRTDLKHPSLTTQRCRACGTTVCWRAHDGDYDRMGVNANLFDPDVVAALPVKYVAGRDWDG